MGTLLGGGVFYLLLYNVTYNADWDGYVAIFKGHVDSRDFLFNFISQIFLEFGFVYSDVYKIHILLMGGGFLYFASRTSAANVFVVLLIYLLFQTVALSNQIRYYVAFSFVLIAMYNIVIEKRKSIFVIFSILAFLSHSGVILMFPFLYLFYKVNTHKYLNKLIVYGIIFSVLFYLLYLLVDVSSSHFSNYLKKDKISSIGGGLFNNTIWIVWFLLVVKIDKRLTKRNYEMIIADNKYQFLYKLSLYSIIFFPISMLVQIFAHRYIAASLIVWIIFIFYSLQYEKSLLMRLRSITFFLIIVLITFLYKYVLATLILGPVATEELRTILLSNQLLFKI